MCRHIYMYIYVNEHETQINLGKQQWPEGPGIKWALNNEPPEPLRYFSRSK